MQLVFGLQLSIISIRLLVPPCTPPLLTGKSMAPVLPIMVGKVVFTNTPLPLGLAAGLIHATQLLVVLVIIVLLGLRSITLAITGKDLPRPSHEMVAWPRRELVLSATRCALIIVALFPIVSGPNPNSTAKCKGLPLSILRAPQYYGQTTALPITNVDILVFNAGFIVQ